LLNWIFILNVGIGLMNLLPLKPLDGGLMVEAVTERYSPGRKEDIVRGLSSLTFALLVAIFLMIFLG
ncbi:MAG: site-2 protease family protein, partial [Candidatus Aenigmatarchaeota archaeon]